jgi:nicotinamide riboside kinase
MKKYPLKIVVCGPESTGKTELAEHLSDMLGADLIPEYARSYVEKLDRPYTYKDVEHIARVQEKELMKAVPKNSRIIILDTYLVITRIWFLEVFGRAPGWIEKSLRNSAIDLYLLCYPDIEWVKDPVRENPDPKRKYLFDRYREEIERLDLPWEEVRGHGEQRFENARKGLLRHYPGLEKDPT